MKKTDLSQYDPGDYTPGAGFLQRGLWFITNIVFFKCPFSTCSRLKRFLLRMFGAKAGTGLVIKPSVNIKHPWRLEIGNHVWIGEAVWIDNLDDVVIGNNCCISQGAMLLCGNHNYTRSSFDLITGKIILEEGTWIGAQSIVAPGITCHSHSVLTAGSLANRDLEAFSIYQGNPAVKVKDRIIQ
ncbi:MAG: WcaF family extracellular polysaccharide biosynthesis acetyltransferase [Bacteroidales bacterium]